MNKTPVSILQEMMVKKHMVPDYVLIHDGGGTHMNTFTYRVTCEGLSATGTGRSKKDAKHEAAKAMLETIAAHRGYPQLPASPAQSPVRTPLPAAAPASPRIGANVPFVNAIGALQALCIDNTLEEPQYIPISDEGPPHARIFTYQCVLSTFKEEGIATTKKQAKHEAARKMLNRIKDLVDDPNLLQRNTKNSQSKISDIIASNIAKERYPELSKLPTKKVKLGLKISDYHIKLKNSFTPDECKELLEHLNSIIVNSDKKDVDEIVNFTQNKFQDILATSDVEITVETLQTSKEGIFMVAMRLSASPILVQCGTGKTENEAKFNAILNLINTIICLLK
ncbi:hypothetical protein KPH14_011000 [Odynerus spinipes]|uniref:DRBM domain-containing protein n=1 Tax=Odynerus spinipes TaxID=1348599 RepID=A0AAD9RXH6_9HYME|nr:hypothetical protein KPH14_011000 [Odynerus spinipes]